MMSSASGLYKSSMGELGKSNDIISKFMNRNAPTLLGQDFSEGFLIEEILSNGKTGEKIRLKGSNLPKIPFVFGGTQRIKKDYYAGYSEPAMQIFGPEETDITINGTFKDKKLPDQYRGASHEIQKLIDAIRIRGNIVRIALGDIERYAVISTTKFELNTLQNINYSITFSIIGFNAPSNAKFLNRTKEMPFAINKRLVDAMNDFLGNPPPPSIPFSIAGLIDTITNAVASAIAAVTDFVDGVLSTVNNIKKSIERAKGLIKYAQNKLREYKKTIGSFKAFDSQQAITGRYESAKFYSGAIGSASSLTSMLEKLKSQISNLQSDIPMARHLVKDGDTFQKLSSRYYGIPDNWKKIKEFNNIELNELVIGSVIEIPRL